MNPASSADASSIYLAALGAIDENISDPQMREWITSFAQQGVKESEASSRISLAEAAAMLSPETQGEIVWKVNKSLDDPLLRQRIAQSLSRKLEAPDPAENRADAAFAKQFLQDGIVGIEGLVSADEAREMREYLRGCADVTRQGTLIHCHPRDIVRMPFAFRIAADDRVLSLVRRHLGTAPTVMQMDAWWSLHGGKPEGAQIFHRDRDDFRACKLFVYLTDVDSKNGPHVFVRGSHDLETVISALAAKGIPSTQAAALFSGNGRQVSAHIEKIFGPAVTEMTGPAGTCFLETTYGFHRGKVPEEGERCLFQVLYAQIPYPDRLKRWTEADLHTLPLEGATSPMARHATRFVTH